MSIEKMEILVKQKLKEIKRGIDFFLRLETEELKMEEYHKFRVLVKKLKAIDFLRRRLMNNPKKLETRYMKAFFKKAGEIREYQLMLHFFCVTKKRNVKIIETIKTRIKELEQNYAVKKQEVLHEKIFRPFTGHLKAESSVEKFIERIIRKIDADIIKYKHFNYQMLDDKVAIHSLRKRLKLYLNLSEIFGNKISKRKLEKIIKVSKILGEWHDCIVNEKRCLNLMGDCDFNPQENMTILEVFNENKSSEKRYLRRFTKEISKMNVTN
jgi:CHAD domain-containing protein